jgi:hypothetical protein
VWHSPFLRLWGLRPLGLLNREQGPWSRPGVRASLKAMSTYLVRESPACSEPADRQRPAADAPAIDWQAFRTASRACCCPARPVVVAVMPPAPGRDHPTDLLLCGHHYRVSLAALSRAGAAVFDGAGRRVSSMALAAGSCPLPGLLPITAGGR